MAIERKGLAMDSVAQGITFFKQGGIVMYFLTIASIFVVFIGIERAFYFARADAGRAFAHAFMLHIANARYAEALALARDQRGAIADILFSAITKNSSRADRMSAYMEIQSGIALSKMRRRIYYLSVIVTMAPLLGLLGTISGMIESFSIFSVRAGEPLAITGGIGEALIATATGLCVAIFALIMHTYFVQKLDEMLAMLDKAAAAVRNALKKTGEDGHAA